MSEHAPDPVQLPEELRTRLDAAIGHTVALVPSEACSTVNGLKLGSAAYFARTPPGDIRHNFLEVGYDLNGNPQRIAVTWSTVSSNAGLLQASPPSKLEYIAATGQITTLDRTVLTITSYPGDAHYFASVNLFAQSILGS